MSFHPPEPMFFGYEDHNHYHNHNHNHNHFQGHVQPLISYINMGKGRCHDPEVNEGTETSDEEGTQKKRLKLEQVKALEKSFELGNKLEPERKRQLARALGLQPRQVAIWFQNRRARWKTKQLEKDYNVLKTQVDSIKADNDKLKNHNNKLHAQLMALKGQESNNIRSNMMNLNKDTEGSWSNGTDNSCEDNTTIYYTQISNNIPTNSSMIRGLTPPYLLGQPLSQTVVAGDEGFCNMLNVIGDQPGSWPWPEAEQQNQHLQ